MYSENGLHRLKKMFKALWSCSNHQGVKKLALSDRHYVCLVCTYSVVVVKAFNNSSLRSWTNYTTCHQQICKPRISKSHRKAQLVWKEPILTTNGWNWSLFCHSISRALAQITWSKTTIEHHVARAARPFVTIFATLYTLLNIKLWTLIDQSYKIWNLWGLLDQTIPRLSTLKTDKKAENNVSY